METHAVVISTENWNYLSPTQFTVYINMTLIFYFPHLHNLAILEDLCPPQITWLWITRNSPKTHPVFHRKYQHTVNVLRLFWTSSFKNLTVLFLPILNCYSMTFTHFQSSPYIKTLSLNQTCNSRFILTLFLFLWDLAIAQSRWSPLP